MIEVELKSVEDGQVVENSRKIDPASWNRIGDIGGVEESLIHYLLVLILLNKLSEVNIGQD